MASETFRTLIIVNTYARHGKAKSVWEKIKKDVLCQIKGETIEILFSPGDPFNETVINLIQNQQINCILTAGGDGTVNYMLNLLMNTKGLLLNQFFLGGIGLGSSNDFIKPVKTKIKNVPVRMGFDTSQLHDVGVVQYCNENELPATRYFLINAGVGVVAEANLYFNSKAPLLGLFKRISTNFAIIYAALRSIKVYKNIHLIINENGLVKKLNLSNLSVIKNNFISGSFHYDQLVDSDEGCLGLNYCYDMTSGELIRTLIDLYSGIFSGKPKTYTSKITQLDVKPGNLIAIETDGEVFRGTDIHFRIRSMAIQVLGL